MAKKKVLPFNPWPGFVDLFASVIMVVLMLMLVLIVNITYYSQFRYKIAYVGSVSVEQLSQVQETVQKKDTYEANRESVLDVATEEIVEEDSTKELQAIAGMDLTLIDSNSTRQESIFLENLFLLKYMNKEIIVDPGSVKDLEAFVLSAKQKFSDHFFEIYIQEPLDQISSSVAKQIALSRVLNVRNVIRNSGYKNEDIVIRLKDGVSREMAIEHLPGYVIVVLRQKP